MQIRHIVLIVFFAVVLPSIVAATYVLSLPPPERWLFIMRPEAQSYADALLSGDTVAQDRYRGDFSDVEVVANPKAKTVLFSSHSDSRQFSLLYAPGESLEWVTYERTAAKRVREKWYALEH